MKKTHQIHRWRKLLSITLSAVLAFNALSLISLAADMAEQPSIIVGDGAATDGSDEWVMEYIEDTTYNRKIYYIKSKATNTYLTASSGWGTGTANEFKPINLTLEEKTDGKLQKWKVQPMGNSQYLLYINDGHILTVNEENKYGMSYQAYNSAFTSNGFKFDGTAETVKFNYKGSGKYLVVKLPGSTEPKLDLDPPANNALKVTDRKDKNHGFKIDVKNLLEPSKSYSYGAYVKLCDTPQKYEYMRLSIEITYTDTNGNAGKKSWKTTPFVTMSKDEYTLVAMDFDTTNLAGGAITNAYIYVDTYSGDSETPPSSVPTIGSTASFIVDAAFLYNGSLANHENNLLENGQFEYDANGNVPGYAVHYNATITYTEPFVDEKTKNADGSVTYKAGVVDLSDENIRLLGHWARETTQLKGYFQSGLELRFTGTSLQMDLSGALSTLTKGYNFFYSIDGGENKKLTSAGTVTLAENLTEGIHTLSLHSNYQEVHPIITRIKLDAGASTLPVSTAPSILFIGDSITVSYFGPTPDYENGFIDGYAAQTANALGFAYAGTAYGGIAILPEGLPDSTGMPSRYFKLGELNSDAADIQYDTTSYQPDYINICLGTNGQNNTPAVKQAYLDFLTELRTAYPNTVIFCMTPFAVKNIETVKESVEQRNADGDTNVHFINASTWVDCSKQGVTSDGTHLVPESHAIVAQKLTAAIKDIITPKYSITVTQPTAGGTISVSTSQAVADTIITVTATPSVGYQLNRILVDGQPIAGNTFTMPEKAVTVTADFRVIPAIKPTVTLNSTQTATTGDNVTLTANASASDGGTLTYQWYKDNNLLSGKTTESLTLENATEADSGDYKVVVTNTTVAGQTAAAEAVCSLTVKSKPVADTPVLSGLDTEKTVTEGDILTLTVTASVADDGALTYQWYRNNTVIAGATAPSYEITDIKTADAGNYQVVVTNTKNGATSSETAKCTITVTPKEESNISSDNSSSEEQVSSELPAASDNGNIGSGNMQTGVSDTLVLVALTLFLAAGLFLSVLAVRKRQSPKQ